MLIDVDILGKDLANGVGRYCFDATKIGIYFDWLFTCVLMLRVEGFCRVLLYKGVAGLGYLG